MINIAIFPIPDCVTFPGTTFPLHVFEPRYRAMVKQCIEYEMPLAICHVQKTVREAAANQTIEEALNKNQSTYKPHDIFSAGQCELSEELPDGRLLTLVHLDKRYKKISETQVLPFPIYACEELPDDDLDSNLSELSQLQEKLLTRLLAVTADMPEVHAALSSAEWQDKEAKAFSFEIFGMLRLDGDIMQKILEKRSPVDRLQLALDLLNQ